MKKLFFILVALVASLVSPAFASVPSTVKYYTETRQDVCPGPFGSQVAAAQCSLAAVVNKPGTCSIFSETSPTRWDMSCTGADTPPWPDYVVHYIVNGLTSCPENSTLDGGVCVCDAPLVESGGACVSDAQLIISGLNSLGLPLVADGPPGLKVCFSGVVVYATGSAGNSSNKDTEYYGPFSTKNEPCTNEQPVETTTCKAGESKGSLNGVEICAPDPSKTNTVAAGPTTSNSGAGGGDGPDIPGAPEGTKSTETTTSCTGESCKTTTVFKNGAGESLGSSEKTEPKTSFCQENPEASICVKGSFSGSCGSVPACSGDAVQCAIARASFEATCFLTAAGEVTEEEGLYGIGKTKTGDQTLDLEGNISIDVGPSSFSQENFLGASQGLNDVTVVVMGRSIVMPFSQVNQSLQWLGLLLMAITLVLCYRVVARG